jgi:hypothetical protein
MSTDSAEIPEVEAEVEAEVEEEEVHPAPKRRGRPKGATDSKPRASRKKAGSAAQPASEPVMEETPAAAQPEEEEAEIEPAPPPPPKPRQRKPRTPESSPEPPPRKSLPHTERKQHTPDSPPLTYLEVLTKGMAMARQAERNEKVARYDAFFQPRM